MTHRVKCWKVQCSVSVNNTFPEMAGKTGCMKPSTSCSSRAWEGLVPHMCSNCCVLLIPDHPFSLHVDCNFFRVDQHIYKSRHKPSTYPPPGIQRHTLDEGFWNKVGYEPSPADVILRRPFVFRLSLGDLCKLMFAVKSSETQWKMGSLRTKRFQSDAHWQTPDKLFLPACVAARCKGDVPPG